MQYFFESSDTIKKGFDEEKYTRFDHPLLAAENIRNHAKELKLTKDDIELIHFMNMTYVKWGLDLEIYYGVLNKDVELVEEVNKLYWIDTNENFFDKEKFAGEGNIGHMLCQVNINKKQIFEGD